MTNPLCIHGKQSFERCVGCESDLLAGKSNGFTRELPPSKDKLTFTMGNGTLKFTADDDGDIVRFTIQYENEDHRWYYLDREEAYRLRELLSAFIAKPNTGYQCMVAGCPANHISKRDVCSAHEPPAVPSALVATLREIALRALAVGPKDHNITLDEIRAISDAAERLAQPPVSEWQPIETAPKDGKTILICGGTFDSEDESYGDMPFPGVSLVYWDSMRLSPHWHGESRDAHDSWFVHKPTHWMPVPAPYSGTTKEVRHD